MGLGGAKVIDIADRRLRLARWKLSDVIIQTQRVERLTDEELLSVLDEVRDDLEARLS